MSILQANARSSRTSGCLALALSAVALLHAEPVPADPAGGKPGPSELQLPPDPNAPNPIIPGVVLGIQQSNHFATGFDELNVPLPIPSIDPAGVMYNPVFGGLLIADSEITEIPEVFEAVGASLFLAPVSGDVTWFQWDLSDVPGNEPFPNLESTGIAYCAHDESYYVTNDDLMLLIRYRFDGVDFRYDDAVSTAPETFDPEGVTCDPQTGRIYVVGGVAENIVVYTYEDGFVLQEELEFDETAGDPAGELEDAEGIAFDPVTRHLFVVSTPAMSIVEYDLAGRFINRFPIDNLSPPPIAPQGLSVGVSSVDPEKSAFYIADGGLDNDIVPSERDGAIYEVLIIRIEPVRR